MSADVVQLGTPRFYLAIAASDASDRRRERFCGWAVTRHLADVVALALASSAQHDTFCAAMLAEVVRWRP